MSEDKKSETSEVELEEGSALESVIRNGFKKTNKSGKSTAVWVKNKVLDYEQELKFLQIELMKLQKHVIANNERVLVIFEGRDAAGKGGTIKRVLEHLNPRHARVVALTKPNDTEKGQWYFQRYVQHLPTEGEIVLFDRSWYNRAMVEPVMGFCSDEQNKRFLKDAPALESLLVKDGIKLFKFYFSVSKEKQQERFDGRKTDPLKQYKLSPVDQLAQEHWDKYSLRKFQMLSETNRTLSPWTIVRSDSKKIARINCIKHMLSSMEYDDKVDADLLAPDDKIIVSGIDELRHMEDHMLTPDKLHG